MQQQDVPIDGQRVVHRATRAMADTSADLACRLGMAEELSELYAVRIAELEQQLEQANAELARTRQANELLTQRCTDLEARAGAPDGAGAPPTEQETPAGEDTASAG